jgi:hypothetical protein
MATMAVLNQRTPLVRGVSRGVSLQFIYRRYGWVCKRQIDVLRSALPHSGHATLPVFKDPPSTGVPLDISRDDMT